MTKETNKELNNADYLNSCTSRYIYNDKHFCSDLWPKSYEFMTVGGKIIRSKKVDSVHLPTHSKAIMTLNNIAYILIHNSNLISLSQVQESGITYYDHFK